MSVDDDIESRFLKAPRWKVFCMWIVTALASLTDIKESRLMLSDVVTGYERRKRKTARDRIIRQQLG